MGVYSGPSLHRITSVNSLKALGKQPGPSWAGEAEPSKVRLMVQRLEEFVMNVVAIKTLLDFLQPFTPICHSTLRWNTMLHLVW